MSPRTSEQFRAIRQDRRQEIIEAAFRLFAERGYEATRIQMITDEAGISKGLFYNYFKNKEEVLDEVAKLIFTEIGEVISRVYAYEPSTDNPKELFREVLNFFKISIRDKREFWTLYARLTFQLQGNQLMKSVMTEEANYNQALARIFQDLGFENPSIEALKFNSLIDGIALNVILREGQYPLEDIFDNITQMYIKEK